MSKQTSVYDQRTEWRKRNKAECRQYDVFIERTREKKKTERKEKQKTKTQTYQTKPNQTKTN